MGHTAVPLEINHDLVPDHVLDSEVLRLSQGLEMDAPRAGNQDPASVRAMALENVIGRTLLLQLAVQRGLHVTAAEEQAELARRAHEQRGSVCDPGSLDTVRQDLLLQRVQDDLTRHVPRPGRAEAETYYRTHQRLFQQAEAVDAAHVFCGFSTEDDEPRALQAITEANTELARGKPFAQVADRFSDCKGVGGAVGWVQRGAMVPEFEDVVFHLPLGRHSDVFRTVFGYHIAKTLRTRAAGVIPFQEVRLEIGRHLHAEARSLALRRTLAQARAASVIRYREESTRG